MLSVTWLLRFWLCLHSGSKRCLDTFYYIIIFVLTCETGHNSKCKWSKILPFTSDSWVPQGSVPGPVLFIWYAQPLSDVISHRSVSYHMPAGVLNCANLIHSCMDVPLPPQLISELDSCTLICMSNHMSVSHFPHSWSQSWTLALWSVCLITCLCPTSPTADLRAGVPAVWHSTGRSAGHRATKVSRGEPLLRLCSHSPASWLTWWNATINND